MTLYVQRWKFDRTEYFANRMGENTLDTIRRIFYGMAEAYWRIDSRRNPNETLDGIRQKYHVEEVVWVSNDRLSVRFRYFGLEISFGDTIVFDKNGFYIELKEEDSDKLATDRHLAGVHISILDKIDELEKRMNDRLRKLENIETPDEVNMNDCAIVYSDFEELLLYITEAHEYHKPDITDRCFHEKVRQALESYRSSDLRKLPNSIFDTKVDSALLKLRDIHRLSAMDRNTSKKRIAEILWGFHNGK